MTTALIPDTKVHELADRLPELEASMSYSLADAIREGATVTDQAEHAWVSGHGEKMCALSAALLAIKARRML